VLLDDILYTCTQTEAIKLETGLRLCLLSLPVSGSLQESRTRQKVSRLLIYGRRHNIVEIRINESSERNTKMEREIENRFSLKEAIVVSIAEHSEDDHLKRSLAGAAFNVLRSRLTKSDRLGITWGTTLSYMLDFMEPTDLSGMRIIQLNGGVSLTSTATGAEELLLRLTQSFNGEANYLITPAIVDSKEINDAIISDSQVAYVLSLCNSVTVAVFSIGVPGEDSILFKSGFLKDDDLMSLRSADAVGDICARYFTIDGDIAHKDLDDRTIGVSLNSLKKTRLSIAVAGGHGKVKAIRGGINGGYCNVLITDSHTANALLQSN
jgi:deoxyribonucleoside regulator